MSTRKTTERIFEAPVIRRLAVIFGLAVAISLLVSLLADEPAPTTTIPSAYSRSALGYEALAEGLEASGMQVLVSRWRSARRASDASAVLVLEPLLEHRPDFDDILRDLRQRSAALVVGLPKWQGTPRRDGWVDIVTLHEPTVPAAVLSSLSADPLPVGAVYRTETPTVCSSALGNPDIPHSLQLIEPRLADFVDPLIRCGDGILVGEVLLESGVSALVISDPDLWNTHGLARAANPPIAQALLTQTLGVRSVIIDETVHGFEHPPSIWQELTTFPLSLFSAHLMGLFVLCVLAAAARFGAPRMLPPRIPPGKGALIENTARLLGMGGHRAYTVHRYFDATIRRLAVSLSLPAGLSRAEQLTRMEQHCEALGLAARPSQLGALVDALPEKNCSPRRAQALAHRIRAMRTEMTRSPHAD